jgi:DNA-binding MarR family transcriptional regulator
MSATADPLGTRSRDVGDEAWGLFMRIFLSQRARFWAISAELDLAPMQAHALRVLEPGRELPMSALADELFCDASNVTGIVDRLEARGLIERRSASGDRRKKLLAITPEGEELRSRLLARVFRAPEPIARLSRADKKALRDVLRRALAEE